MAKELGVDEGTVRRDRKFLSAAEPNEPRSIRSSDATFGPLAGVRDAVKSPEPDPLLVTDAVKRWVEKEGMVREEIERVLQGARKRLDWGRDTVRSLLVSRRSPEELIAFARPKNRDKEEIIPNTDFWADWLARGLALCFPRREELQEEVLRDTAIWARSRR
jgi:hypothetical protein